MADGIGLAGFGVFFLLATTRGLPAGFWLEALSMWPVLLISAGIRIVFEKSPLPFGVVLGPLVVLGTLTWLAWGHPPEASPPGPWREVSAGRPSDLREVRLDVRGIGARLEVASRPLPPGVLAEGRVASRDDTEELEERVGDSGVSTLRIEGEHGGAIFVPGRKAVWELAVADDVPLEIELGGIMSGSRFHLERGIVSRVKAHGPFQSIELRLPPPSLPEPVRIQLQGPFCAFDLIVPEGTPVHVRKDNPFLIVMQGPAREEPLGDEPGYEVSLTGPFCTVTIDEEALPEGVVPRPMAPREPPLPAEVPAEAPPEAPEAPPAEKPPAEATP